jgi:hypothetical protein
MAPGTDLTLRPSQLAGPEVAVRIRPSESHIQFPELIENDHRLLDQALFGD